MVVMMKEKHNKITREGSAKLLNSQWNVGRERERERGSKP